MGLFKKFLNLTLKNKFSTSIQEVVRKNVTKTANCARNTTALHKIQVDKVLHYKATIDLSHLMNLQKTKESTKRRLYEILKGFQVLKKFQALIPLLVPKITRPFVTQLI